MSTNEIGMRRGFFLILLLAFSMFGYSQQDYGTTWLWQVSGGELQGKSYILGAMPLQDSTYFQFDSRLWKNLSKTDVFVSFDEEINDNQIAAYRNITKEYGVTPKNYIENIVKQEFKPTVNLSQSNSLSQLVKGKTGNIGSPTQLRQLEEAYLSADHQSFVDLRLQLDISAEVYQSLGKKYNYILINELIDQMRLQPVFVSLDPLYVTGTEGIIGLLRARGYLVKPVAEKFYVANATRIAEAEQMRLAWQQQTQPSTPTQTTGETKNPNQAIPAPTSPTQNVKLDLPMGVLNLSEWSDYEIKSPSINYSAPLRLKSKDENGAYESSYGGLTYKIEVMAPWENTKMQIEKLIIQNGGQLVGTQKFISKGVQGEQIELMYTENQISRHLLLAGVNQNVIVSVKGKTPAIHTVLADAFLQSIVLEQLPETPMFSLPAINKPSEPATPAAPVVQWSSQSLSDLRFLFPLDFIEEEATLESGETVKALIASKKVDQNTFVIVSSKKDTFDNFQLFNTSINRAATEVRGVVVERNVMPAGRPNFAEYTIKDAVDRYYRVQYYYIDGTFYQIIVKGDKKSVVNENANQFLNSIFIP